MTWSETAWLWVLLLGSGASVWWLVRRPKRASYRAYASGQATGSGIGILIYVFGQFALTVGAAYVVIHFIVKYW